MSDEIEEEETEGPIGQENDQDSLESLKKDLQYALAEVANIRARAAKERSEMMRYGSKNLGLRMIEVLLSLEMAIGTMDEASESVIDGVRLTVESMRQGLSSVGITQIDLGGKSFDPGCMEAIAIVPPPDGEPSGTILNVVEKGYMIHDRVLRPAKVIVSE